ncbi:hypothetical protein FXO38_22106 [Capsicum annuum]|nr:hypothetical protein FXO38_22106 [Capsicum annuum]
MRKNLSVDAMDDATHRDRVDSLFWSLEHGLNKIEPDYNWIYQRNNDNSMGLRVEFVKGVRRFVEHAETIDAWSRFWAIHCPCVRCDGYDQSLYFILEPMWQDYLHYWNSEGYQLLIEKGKKVRASSKGDSLHITGAVSWITLEQKMDKYMQLVAEYRSTQPLESQGDTIPEVVEEELWQETVGPPVRGQYYGYYRKYFGENVRSSSNPTSYPSPDREGKGEGAGNIITNQDAAAAIQLFYSIYRVLPPCPGDAVRAAKGLGPPDNISTDEESDPVCAAEDADDEEDDDEW